MRRINDRNVASLRFDFQTGNALLCLLENFNAFYPLGLLGLRNIIINFFTPQGQSADSITVVVKHT